MTLLFLHDAMLFILPAWRVCLQGGCVCREGVSTGRVCLQGGCVCMEGVSAGRVCLQGGCVCRESVSAGRVCLHGGCVCMEGESAWVRLNGCPSLGLGEQGVCGGPNS